jgi:hypothetical protein
MDSYRAAATITPNIPTRTRLAQKRGRVELLENTMNVRLTRDELLAISGHSEQGFKTKLRRGQWAIAYSGTDAGARAWYRPEDAVAACLATSLAETFGMDLAASLVRAFAGTVLVAIATAEADPTTDTPFGVVDLVNADGKRAFLASTTTLQVVKPGAGYVVERVISVNLSHLVRVVRANAAYIGLDLSARFLPPPNSTEFDQIVQPYAELEGGGIVEIKAIKKRDIAAQRVGAKARAIAMRGADIGSKARVTDMTDMTGVTAI